MNFETAKNSHGELVVVVHHANIDTMNQLMESLGYHVYDTSALTPLPTFLATASHYYCHRQYGIASFDGTLIETVNRSGQLCLQSLVADQVPFNITMTVGADMKHYLHGWTEDEEDELLYM